MSKISVTSDLPLIASLVVVGGNVAKVKVGNESHRGE